MALLERNTIQKELYIERSIKEPWKVHFLLFF